MNISEEIIDSFVRGELKGSELNSFNNAVAANPQLQEQVAFQKQIVGSINQFRHQQLKGRLNAIPVKPLGVSILASNYVKIATTITALAILLGVGGYAVYDNLSTDTNSIVSNTNSSEATTTGTSRLQYNALPSNKEVTPITTAVPKQAKPNTAKSTQSNTKATSVNTVASKTVNPAIKSPDSNKESAINTDYSDPQMESDNMINGINDNFEMPSMNTGGIRSSISTPQIKVNIIKDNDLGYRFFNNQLFLHGNFSNSTYELLELNNKPTKQLFLYFENNYYELIQGKTKTTPLSPIKDSTVLLQLNQLRAH